MEIRIAVECAPENISETTKHLEDKGLIVDKKYKPIPIPADNSIMILGSAEEKKIEGLGKVKNVIIVYTIDSHP